MQAHHQALVAAQAGVQTVKSEGGEPMKMLQQQPAVQSIVQHQQHPPQPVPAAMAPQPVAAQVLQVGIMYNKDKLHGHILPLSSPSLSLPVPIFHLSFSLD